MLVCLQKYVRLADGTETVDPISGAEFCLYDAIGDVQIGGLYYTGADGRIEKTLPPGNYYFLETRPGNGFVYDNNQDGSAITRYDIEITGGETKTVIILAYNLRDDLPNDKITPTPKPKPTPTPTSTPTPKPTPMPTPSPSPNDDRKDPVENITPSPEPNGEENGPDEENITPNPESNDGGMNPKEDAKPKPVITKEDSGKPKTSDDSNLALWIALMAFSVIGLIAVLIFTGNKRKGRYIPKH
jgi:hypothetical protein